MSKTLDTALEAEVFLPLPAGPAHDAFIALNTEALAADLRVAELAKRYIEVALGPEIAYVDFGWDDACEGAAVRGFRTADQWDLDSTGRNVGAGIAYEEDSFDDIDDIITLLDCAYQLDIELLRRFGNSGMEFRIHSAPGDPGSVFDELKQAYDHAVDVRARTEVAAIHTLRERLPLNVTAAHLGECLLHTFMLFRSVANGSGTHHSDELMWELDQYAEAIRNNPSQAALDAGLATDGDGYVLQRRP